MNQTAQRGVNNHYHHKSERLNQQLKARQISAEDTVSEVKVFLEIVAIVAFLALCCAGVEGKEFGVEG